MATSFEQTFQGVFTNSWDVTATADADTVLAIPHGLQQVPFVFITPSDQAVAELSAWAVTSVDDTNINLEKSVAVGSGNASAQLRVQAIAQQARMIG